MSAAGIADPSPYSNSPNSSFDRPVQPSRTESFNGGGDVVFAHVEDLKARALSEINFNVSIGKLYETAERAFNQAKTNLDFRRPDLAFVEYLRACEIVVETLPRHKDYTLWSHDQHGNSQKLALLRRKVQSMDKQFDNIKQIIINNNLRHGTLPRRAQSVAVAENVNGDSLQSKSRPPVSPKPDRLLSNSISTSNSNGDSAPATVHDVLSDRFARLRGVGQLGPAGPSLKGSTLSSNGATSSPRGSSTYARDSMDSLFDSLSISKPQGPRSMPDGAAGQTRPLRLPLDTNFTASMPQAPMPTYSPARNMETTGNIAPPRYSARSLAGTNARRTSYGPSVVAPPLTPNGTGGENHQASFNSSTRNLSVPPRRKSVHMPKEGSITAERLYDYLERYNILLIDFRSREDFDHGHIFARNVICIDPLIMQPGLSAEQLSDKLVLSPESEQDLFYKRDSFELVVFYDSSTGSEGFLIRPQTELEMKLKQLHEALYDFNQDRPLQRPPIFLIGGIQAWIDLMGTQALQTSDTLTRVKPGRQIQRRPLRSDGPVQVPKRRVREYDPLDADEERKWRDRAISESVPSAPVALPDDTQDDESSDQQGDEPDKYPSIEDFNARFPDANQLSPSLPLYDRPTEMTNHAVRIPTYPSRPPLSTLPQAPMRPAPAAPRMSYTGVSERSVSQTTLVPRTNSGLTPYVPSKYLASNLRLPRTGLYNFGSTCYMNATLQALSATTPLSIMFLDDGFKSAVQKDNWKGSSGLLPEIYSNVIRNMWNGESSYIKPSTFRSFCARLNKTFSDPHQQQDAHEFFSFLVDCLHEDFNGVWSRSPLRPLTLQEEAKRERMPKMVVARMEWNRWAHRDNSYISSLLYGQSSSRLRCPECGTTSTQYDAWAGLQVEIPECREARLQDCLRAHFRDELLDDGNQWTCPSCKKPRRASKKLTITRLPPYLAITLGRFRTEGSSQRKVHTQVRFPLTGLDLAEFLVQPPSSPAEVQQIMAAYGPESLKPPDTAQVPPFIYDAYAVVQHHGQSTRSGHYTCAAKDPARGCWRLFNDTGAKDFDPHSSSASASHGGEGHALDNDLAYMIFYQRRRVTGTTSDSAANGRGERQ